MSKIDRMTIQGIRSYGPKAQDTQVIEFFSPVTLIVGQNGCGKTTVIECLKYATTSDLPPNTKGSSFVFDPKLVDEVETKGQVKLFFRDTSGLSVQVQKNLCSTQKSKKLEFRTLETIISRYNEENKLMSTITSKCINADAEVINALGVSKAVLENVIFTHQEESNWPLSDGKLLKTRFDEIFAATKYIKALDILRKVRLEKQAIIKQLEIEKKHLEGYKTRSDQLSRDLDENTKKHETLGERKQEVLLKIKPIQKKLDLIFQESAKILEIKTVLERIENEKELLERQIKELLANTKDCLFTGSDEELKEYIQAQNSKTSKMRKEEEDAINRHITSLQNDLKIKSQDKSKLAIEIGALENRMKQFEEKKQLFQNLTEKIFSMCSKSCDYLSFDPQNGVLLSEIGDMIEQYEQEVRTFENEYKQKEKMFQNELESLRETKSKLELTISNKTEQMSKAKLQINQINDELNVLNNEKTQNELSQSMHKFEEEIKSESAKLLNVNEIKEKIDDLELKKSALKRREVELDDKITRLHADSKIKTEIDLLKREKDSKESQIRKIKNQIRDELETFFKLDDSDSSLNKQRFLSDDLNLKEKFDVDMKKMLAKLSSCEEKQKECEKRLYSSELKRKMLYDEQRVKETQLRECEDRLLQLTDCIQSQADIENYDRILEDLQEKHKNNMDEKGFLSGVDKTYKRFLSQLQSSAELNQSDHCKSCPICMRDFKNEHELDETVKELKKFTNKLPQKINDIESKLKQSEQQVDQMINMKSTKEMYDRLKFEQLPQLRQQIDQLDRDVLPKIKKELKEHQETLRELETQKKCSDHLQNEIVLIDKYACEARDLDRKLKQSVSCMNTSSSLLHDSQEHDLSTLNQQKQDLQHNIEELNREIDENRNDMQSNYSRMDKVNNLKEKLNQLKSKSNEFQMKLEKRGQMRQRLDELKSECNEFERDLVDLKAKLNKCMEQIESLNKRRLAENEEFEELFYVKRSSADELKSFKIKLDDCVNVMNSIGSNVSVNELKSKIKAIEQEEAQVERDIGKQRNKLDEIKKELLCQEMKQRNLMDNLRLREKRAEYQSKLNEYKEKQDELKQKDIDIDFKNFKSEQAKLEAQRNELNKEYNEIQSSMNSLDGRLQTIREELSLESYKNATEKYMNCASDLRVLEISVLDIEKYYKALDRALMNYHGLKMNEINKTIKQLWRQVYRGNDIDYIEIRSEEEASNEEQVTIKSRRSYNYRVVLIKGDACLDMRGRCSAGQKVLASIIIRLALAETFCLNSGILALDEPTTNLDRENIESLASALVE
jgi:DNA repair protein RAD50